MPKESVVLEVDIQDEGPIVSIAEDDSGATSGKGLNIPLEPTVSLSTVRVKKHKLRAPDFPLPPPPARDRTGIEVLQPGEKIYPYTDAEFIEQNDITDEGIPPEPRAGPPADHQRLRMLVRSATDLPQMDLAGKCDCYCKVSFDNQEHQSTIKFNCFDCSWNETFEFFLHEANINFAKLCGPSGSCGKTIMVALYDWDRLKRADLVGRISIDLAQIVNMSSEGQDFTVALMSQTGEDVIGHNGRATQVSFHIQMLPIAQMRHWQPPSLSQTLSTVGGESKLKGDFTRTSSTMSGLIRSNASVQTVGNTINDMFLEWEDVEQEENDNDKYWREQLARAMESLWINALVLCLVVTDVVSILVFLNDSSTSSEPPVQIGINMSVGSVFVIELTLRQLALRRRFWFSIWNIFDFVVIWFSAGIMISRFIMVDGAGGITGGLSGTNTASGLRILSRVAVGARVLRILLGIRRARKISGAVNQKLRTAVSQNKRRYKKHGYDLDLTYITNRVIAMSAPAFGGHTAYRNDIHVVARFLSLRHHGKFFVFNLCDTYTSSDGSMGNYHPQMLYNQVQRIPFEDHAPPLLAELIYFCQEASSWLQRDRKNVVVVHCKGGKGRTGVMIAALLMWTGHRRSALDALELFAYRRTEDFNPDDELDEVTNEGSSCMWRKQVKHNQSVEGPSQQRYVHYVEAVLYSGIDPWVNQRLFLSGIELCGSRLFDGKRNVFLSYTVSCQRIMILDSLKRFRIPQQISPPVGLQGLKAILPSEAVLWGDVRIEFFAHKNLNTNKRKLIWFITFNTAFHSRTDKLVFPKRSIDMLHKDKNNTVCDIGFKITLTLSSSIVRFHSQKMLSDASSHITDLKAFFDLFTNNPCARRICLKKDQYLITEGAREERLFMVESGVLEGVIVSSRDDSVSYHALGSCVPQSGGQQNLRVPVICIHGKGAIIGASQFLNRSSAFGYRVRGQEAVVIEVLKDKRDEEEPEILPSPTVDSNGNGMVRASMESTGSQRSTMEDALHRLSSFLRGESSSRITRRFHAEEDRRLLEEIFYNSTVSSASVRFDLSDVRVLGVSDAELQHFYHGLSISLSIKLDRSQLEATRIASLKSFTDAQTAVGNQDVREKLRDSCIKTFDLPLNQKLLQCFKCHFKRMGDNKSNRTRIIFLNQFVIIDPLIFGPLVDSSSILLHHSQIHGVAFANQFQATTVVVHFSEQKDDVTEDVQFSCELTFQNASRAHQILNLFEKIIRISAESGFADRELVYQNPAVAYILHKCGKVHHVGKKELFRAARNSTSLFFVYAGEIKLCRPDGVHKIVRKGFFFGMSNFVQCKPAATYTAQGGTTRTNIVLELPNDSVAVLQEIPSGSSATSRSYMHARFFHYLCTLLEREYRDVLKEIFPGSWCQSDFHMPESQGAKKGERKHGWMKQKGYFSAVWKQRFFVLDKDVLNCFTESDALRQNATPKRRLLLADCEVEYDGEGSSFMLRDNCNKRDFHLVCSSQLEASEWVSSIKSGIAAAAAQPRRWRV